MTHPPINEQITFLYTRDIGKTASFYEEIMGLRLALDQGGCRIYRVAGDKGYLGICERDYAPKSRKGSYSLLSPMMLTAGIIIS